MGLMVAAEEVGGRSKDGTNPNFDYISCVSKALGRQSDGQYLQ